MEKHGITRDLLTYEAFGLKTWRDSSGSNDEARVAVKNPWFSRVVERAHEEGPEPLRESRPEV